MNTERKIRFYTLLKKLLSLTQIVNQKPDTDGIAAIMDEIGPMFRLSKGVTHFYRNPGDEKNGIGETICTFDTGREGHPVHTVRFVTRLMSISTMTVYMTDDAEPLTEEELSNVDITMRTALAFLSRNRLQDIAEQLAFFDDAGFRNTRNLFRYIAWKNRTGDFDGMAAVNYNLQNFSLVNKEYGREGGDIVLMEHYKRVEKIIGENGIVARLGGDSFVCICEQADLPELLEFLNEANVLVNKEGATSRISAYVGVYQIPNGTLISNPGDIMGNIINTCQIAKTGINGNIVYFSDILLSQRERVQRIQMMFPDALRNHEFCVFYQPKVNICTGEICGAEALCRWFHDGRIIPPMDFIPVLEESSEICKLDFYMLDCVCGHIRKWLDEKRHVPRVSVNLSRRHMTNPKLVSTLIEIIDRHGVPHEYIEMELTETTTDVEFKDLRRVAEELHEQNIHTSVDDFGMGYSSLNLIRVVPWDVLKIDKAFVPVDGESEDSTRSVMFRHVAHMAKELGLDCIVEGIETKEQLNYLRKNGCEKAQGYLYDKPLPLEEFEKRLDMVRYTTVVP